MLMKAFPHGTGAGDKPSRYLVRRIIREETQPRPRCYAAIPPCPALVNS